MRSILVSIINSPISSTNQVISGSFINTNNDSSVKILVNANNSIIHTTNSKSITTVEDKSSKFKLKTKMLYKGSRAMITGIIPHEDEFLEPVYKIGNRLGKLKIVQYNDIRLELLVIPSGISFPTKKVVIIQRTTVLIQLIQMSSRLLIQKILRRSRRSRSSNPL